MRGGPSKEEWAEVADKGASELFIDLQPYLEGDIKLEKPSVAECREGVYLFYAGRLNEIHAEPGVGKSNVLMQATILVTNAGGRVLYIDPEDKPSGFAMRIKALGCDTKSIQEKVCYLHNPNLAAIIRAQQLAKEEPFKMVITDGNAELMAVMGYSEDKSDDVLQFIKLVLRPFSDQGAAVVIADHVVKNPEERRGFARGSGAKKGRYDGVSYEAIPSKPYGPDLEGHFKLRISKDRNGGVGAQNTIAHIVNVKPIEGLTSLTFEKPTGNEAKQEFAEMIGRIESFLREHGEANKTMLRTLGNSDMVDRAIRKMIEQDRLKEEKRGRAKIYTLIEQKLDFSPLSAHLPESAPTSPMADRLNLPICPSL
jgi:hypothetical protein